MNILVAIYHLLVCLFQIIDFHNKRLYDLLFGEPLETIKKGEFAGELGRYLHVVEGSNPTPPVQNKPRTFLPVLLSLSKDLVSIVIADKLESSFYQLQFFSVCLCYFTRVVVATNWDSISFSSQYRRACSLCYGVPRTS